MLPTDTVYGIGADAFDNDAVAALLSAKGRGRDMPMPVLVGSWHTIDGLVYTVPHSARSSSGVLARRAEPRGAQAPSLQWDLGDAHGTVMLRCRCIRSRSNCCARSARWPCRAPTSPVAAAAVDARPAINSATSSRCLPRRTIGQQAASTIVDLTGAHPRVLRQGPCTVEAIAKVLGVEPESPHGLISACSSTVRQWSMRRTACWRSTIGAPAYRCVSSRSSA